MTSAEIQSAGSTNARIDRETSAVSRDGRQETVIGGLQGLDAVGQAVGEITRALGAESHWSQVLDPGVERFSQVQLHPNGTLEGCLLRGPGQCGAQGEQPKHRAVPASVDLLTAG